MIQSRLSGYSTVSHSRQYIEYGSSRTDSISGSSIITDGAVARPRNV